MPLLSLVPDSLRNLRAKVFRRTRHTLLFVLLVLLVLCIVFAWTTRDALTHLPFLGIRGQTPASMGAKKTIVELSPWQTAQALAPLAVTAEEKEFAQAAERLADHEVDQAFASALRQATIQVQHTTLTGEALVLSKRVDQLQQLVNQDRAVVRQLTPASNSGAAAPKGAAAPDDDDTDLEIAKAQLQLDSDQLDDAQEDLARSSGDERAQIQSELNAHEATMKQYDNESHDIGQIAVLSVSRYGTLVSRLGAWNRQRTRYQLLQQAIQQGKNEIRSLTDQHHALESKVSSDTSALSAGQDRNSRLASIKEHSAEHQLLSIYDDRIQTEQQLASVYTKWAAQVQRQHRILLHLILQSTAFIVFVLICMLLGDGLIRRVMASRVIDRRNAQTLRMILELCVQFIGAAIILIVLFGAPHQTPTILGVTTAALTFVLQDFVLAFFGWFVLMGKKGIRVGDWVEINGVGGEVTELGLMKTTLLETGNLADRGYPTGRRITFMNSFAIRGQYFNFSTTGQWMWDAITIAVPGSLDSHEAVDRILQAVRDETQDNTRIAEQEWKRGTYGDGLSNFRTDPAVNLRPSGSGVDLEVRYVTRASERFEMRNHLYQHLFSVLQELSKAPHSQPAS